jgi:hypothetical protein
MKGGVLTGRSGRSACPTASAQHLGTALRQPAHTLRAAGLADVSARTAQSPSPPPTPPPGRTTAHARNTELKSLPSKSMCYQASKGCQIGEGGSSSFHPIGIIPQQSALEIRDNQVSPSIASGHSAFMHSCLCHTQVSSTLFLTDCLLRKPQAAPASFLLLCKR